jgi:hypothetical protein
MAPLGAQSRRDWMIGPFEKPRAANPVLVPRATTTFRSPVNDSTVRWEEHATFNPAAIARNGRIVMLYRAEDDPGSREIGKHTSRLGMAESADGLRFTRRDTPGSTRLATRRRSTRCRAASRIRGSSRPRTVPTCSRTRNGIATCRDSPSPRRRIS